MCFNLTKRFAAWQAIEGPDPSSSLYMGVLLERFPLAAS